MVELGSCRSSIFPSMKCFAFQALPLAGETAACVGFFFFLKPIITRLVSGHACDSGSLLVLYSWSYGCWEDVYYNLYVGGCLMH